MSKMNGRLACTKSAIAKEKLCDAHFDQLVIDTSHRVTQKLLSARLNSPSPDFSLSQEPKQYNFTSSNIANDNSLNRLNQPKRPMNAFMVWGQTIRRELHQRFSNVQNALLSKALGRVWRSLDSTEKEPYIRKAIQIKTIHKRNYPDYRYQPRRVEERRVKNNTLIGINLNHPSGNQHPIRQTVFNISVPSQTLVNSNEYFNPQTQDNVGQHLKPEPAYQGTVQPNNIPILDYNPYLTAQTQQHRVERVSYQCNIQDFGHEQQQQSANFQPYQHIRNSFTNQHQYQYSSSTYNLCCVADTCSNNGQQYNE